MRPSRPLTNAFEQRMALSQKRRAEYASIKNLPATTTDGERVTLMVNAGLAEDATAHNLAGADGIGLFRTEFQFLIAGQLPGRESQLRLYKQVLEAAGDKPVIFRTVDIGGDKALPYLTDEKDEAENPAMGWRALRLSARAHDLDEGAGTRADRGRQRADFAGHVPDGFRAVGI